MLQVLLVKNMNIFIIRHGETAFNVGEHKFRGRMDISLSELGLKHAEQTGKSLSNIPLDIIHYSKLSRTRITASKIGQNQKNTQLLEEPFLYDISFGDWEGKANREVFSSKEEEQRWHTDPHSFIIPNGETFYQVLDRIHRLFKRLENQKEENIALVSHGVVIALMFVYLYKTHPSNFWKFFVKPCSISHIVLRESGNFKLVKINDCHHLHD